MKVKAKLEQITEVEITIDRLNESIGQCNQERELLKEISLMRKSDNPPISAKDFVMMNHASMIVDKKIFIGQYSNHQGQVPRGHTCPA